MTNYAEFDFDRVDFVTSDTHFSHARISELAGRPFSTVDEMDAELIRRWNELVAPDAVVLHLGDLALGPIEESIRLTSRLHGRRFLVPGNHDRVSPATQSRRAIERFAPLYKAAGWTILQRWSKALGAGTRFLPRTTLTPGTASRAIAIQRIAHAGTTASRFCTGTPMSATTARTVTSFMSA